MKPKTGIWKTGYYYPGGLSIEKVVIRYPKRMFLVEEKIKEIEKLVEKK